MLVSLSLYLGCMVSYILKYSFDSQFTALLFDTVFLSREMLLRSVWFENDSEAL